MGRTNQSSFCLIFKNIGFLCRYCIVFLILTIPLFSKPDQKITPIIEKAKDYFFIEKDLKLTHYHTSYRIFVAKSKIKYKKYKVIYLLDGNAFFSRFLNLYNYLPKEDILIVGIGYDSPLAFDTTHRTKDYTPKVQGLEFQNGGGSFEFRQFIKTELLPYINTHYETSEDFQILFGHSFGGLFALDTLFNDTKLFSHYFIISPSLWWGGGEFIPKRISLSNCPQIYMALGSAESNSSIKKAKAKISVKELGMQILNHSACEVEFKLFENETHGSVIEKAMIWAIENIKSEPID
ncbi:alpha/beta hydrolase [Campylobacter coli]|nr:alpha/beta hydrolase [Campylobacter coli]